MAERQLLMILNKKSRHTYASGKHYLQSSTHTNPIK